MVKASARKIGPLRQLTVQEFEVFDQPFVGRAHRIHIPPFRRRAHEAPEEIDELTVGRGLRPGHPGIGLGAHARVRVPQRSRAILGRQIADDGARFPDNRVAVAQNRHPPVRVERGELGRIEPAELAARVDTFVRHADLAQGPHGLLHVDRIPAAPNRQHVGLSEIAFIPRHRSLPSPRPRPRGGSRRRKSLSGLSERRRPKERTRRSMSHLR